MEEQQVRDIINRYLEGTASEHEASLVREWMLLGKFPQVDISEIELLKSLDRIEGKLELARAPKKVRLWPRIAVAASIMIVLSIGGFWLLNNDVSVTAVISNADADPGKQGATLTLADGRKIVLSNAGNGQVASESGVRIVKKADGSLVYEMLGSEGSDGENRFNTVSTSNGETYQVRLPDGTMVWLNAASSLRYRVNLASVAKRKVELSGEGYFEVAKDISRPFVVSSGNQQVEVLGTHFNINAYSGNRNTKTTLLEGSVRVDAGGGNVRVIAPGEQADYALGNLSVKEVDVDDVVAWKDGYIVFDRERVDEIMRQISRWYDVEVVYLDESVKSKLLGGSMSRNVKLSKVIKRLEQVGGVKIELEGKQLTIDKKNK